MLYGCLTTGLKCVRHHISESGGGKTTLDCHFSYVMNHLLKAVKEGQGSLDVVDSDSALRALIHEGGLPATQTFKFTINSSLNLKTESLKYFTLFNSRSYIHDSSNNLIELRLTRQSFRSFEEIRITKDELYSKLKAGDISSGTGVQLFHNEITHLEKSARMISLQHLMRKSGRNRKKRRRINRKLQMNNTKEYQSQANREKKEE